MVVSQSLQKWRSFWMMTKFLASKLTNYGHLRTITNSKMKRLMKRRSESAYVVGFRWKQQLSTCVKRQLDWWNDPFVFKRCRLRRLLNPKRYRCSEIVWEDASQRWRKISLHWSRQNPCKSWVKEGFKRYRKSKLGPRNRGRAVSF